MIYLPTLEMTDHAISKGLLVCNAFRHNDLNLPADLATQILDQLHHQAAQSIINLWYRHVKTKIDLAKEVIENMSVPNSPYNNDTVDFDKMFYLIRRVNIMINFAVDDAEWWRDKLVNLMSQVSNVKALCQDIGELEYPIAHNLIISRIDFIEKQIQFHNRKVDFCRFAPSDETQMIDWYNLDWGDPWGGSWSDFDGIERIAHIHKDVPRRDGDCRTCRTQIRNKLLRKYKVLPEWLFYWWNKLDQCVSIHDTDIAERAEVWLQDCDPEIFDNQLWTIYVMNCHSI